ncbi:MAG: pirin family protein [Polyangiales bacterium]
MIKVRHGEQRGASNHGWLDSKHSFSFADYHDPANMGFRSLRVINEDQVTAGKGFGTHSHRDMEIVSYVLSGALEHKDSIGTGSVIRPGDVQRMSAGTGVAHSEYNHSKTDPVHFLQIWIVPQKSGLKPSYEQKTIADADRRGKLKVVASPDGRDGSVTVHQDMTLSVALLEPGERVTFSLADGRGAWVQLARGAVKIGDVALKVGDGAQIENEREVTLEATEAAEILVFDLA